MSRTTPRVDGGRLHDQAEAVVLGTPEWYSWLDDDRHHSFHFTGPSGEFTARKERKQRGNWYWVAYRQIRGKLHKTYLGKSAGLTEAHLQAAARTLQTLAGGHTTDEHAEPATN